MSTAERLENYYPFDQDVIDRVREVAEQQAEFETYPDFLASQGIEESEYTNGKRVGLVDIRPKEHDPNNALVISLPMANPLDTNQLYAVSTISAALPNTRVIAMGNPAGPGYRYPGALLNHEQRKRVISGDLSPLSEPRDRYLENEGITVVDHYGYSYGERQALASSINGNHEVDTLTILEPASVVKRFIGLLGIKFMMTNGALKQYVEATGLGTFVQARKDAIGLVSYSIGLVALTNIAAARSIARGDFAEKMKEAMFTQPSMVSNVAWGTKSELAKDEKLVDVIEDLHNTEGIGVDRVIPRPLLNHKHSVANDIHLQAAVVLQGLKGKLA